MSGLKIMHFIPCYRSTLRIESAYSMVRDCTWAQRSGHEITPIYVAGWSVERARNHALRMAIDSKMDLLLMQDADVFADNGLAELVFSWRGNAKPAVLGAPVPLRGKDAVNCLPYLPGEVFDGVVGAGLLLIDVKQLANIQPPWFTVRYTEDGTGIDCGEDIGFCRLVRDAGLRVLIDARIKTGHVGDAVMRSHG